MTPKIPTHDLLNRIAVKAKTACNGHARLSTRNAGADGADLEFGELGVRVLFTALAKFWMRLHVGDHVFGSFRLAVRPITFATSQSLGMQSRSTSIPASGAPFLVAVPDIVGLGSPSKMIGIAAQSNVTGVQREQSGILSRFKEQRQSVRRNIYSTRAATNADSRATIRNGAAFPEPAFIWTFPINLEPKTEKIIFRKGREWFTIFVSHLISFSDHVVEPMRRFQRCLGLLYFPTLKTNFQGELA